MQRKLSTDQKSGQFGHFGPSGGLADGLASVSAAIRMSSVNPGPQDMIGLQVELAFDRAQRQYSTGELPHVEGRDGWPGAELIRDDIGGGGTESLGLVYVYIGAVNTS